MFRSGEQRRSSAADRGDTRKRLRSDEAVRPSHGQTFEDRRRHYLPFHAHLDERVGPSHPEGALSGQELQERWQEQQGSSNQDTQTGSSYAESPVFFSHLQNWEERLFAGSN